MLRREDDGRPFGTRREARERPWLPDERLSFEPSEIDRVTRPLGARDHQVGPHAEAVAALDGRELELPRQLASARLGRGEHGRLVQQRARVGSLSCRLEVDDDRILRQVVEQRRSRGIEVGGVKLDARKCGARAQARQLVLPFRSDVPAQALQRNRFAQPRDGGGATLRADQQLAPRPDRHLCDRHHRTLVVGLEQTQRLHRVADPLGPDRCVRRRGKHVQDAAAQGELPSFLDKRLAGVTQLDQPAGDGDGVRPLARP